MILLRKLLIFTLLALPLSSILYKNYVAKIDLIPQSATNKWHLSVSYPLEKMSKNKEQLPKKLPFFSSTPTQIIRDISFIDGSSYKISDSKENKIILLRKNDFKKTRITALMNIELTKAHSKRPLRGPLFRKEKKDSLKKYLDLHGLTEEELDQINLLNRKIISPHDGQREKAQKIYFFVAEEISHDEAINSLSEALTLSSGSHLIKSQILTTLCRLNNIPARINIIYELNKTGQVSKLNQTFMPEILIGRHWTLLTTHLNPFDNEIKDFFIFYKNYDDFPEIFKNKEISVNATSVMINKVDSTLYKNKLKSTSSFFSILSLHNLPVSIHSVFYTVLLIPLGTLILSFSRNLLGIKSFGIFTPILLSLFFLETSLITGLIFFSLIVLLGFGQRYLLDKLYLLAIPRLSILLTLVIISYTLFNLMIYQNSDIFHVNQSFNYLPIVIITGFIERFSIHFIEEGPLNTVKALLGTLTISLLCYTIFNIDFLKQMLFNNPELLLSLIALNLMIGSYKGYRLSELFRFKEFKEFKEEEGVK